MSEATAIQKVSTFMRSDLVKERFAEVVGDRNAGAYISSVLLAVASSKNLQECNPESIYVSAMRAATLRLSVDPSTGQAYMVPFGGKATLIVGYKGLYDMAVRTGRYRYVNVNPIYEGVTVTPHPISGLITLSSLGGQRVSDKIVGWLGAFEMNPERGQMTGFAHTMYMTVEEIHAHAKKYSKSYSHKDSGWQTDPQAMERKTVLRLLLRRWGYLDPSDVSVLESIENDPESIDVEPVEIEEHEPAPRRNEAEILSELGFGDNGDGDNPDPITDKDWQAWLALCNDAEKLDIDQPVGEREGRTHSELRQAYNELKKRMVAATPQTA